MVEEGWGDGRAEWMEIGRIWRKGGGGGDEGGSVGAEEGETGGAELGEGGWQGKRLRSGRTWRTGPRGELHVAR